jgi:hypothetical protein
MFEIMKDPSPNSCLRKAFLSAERFLIRGERCLSYHNESPRDLPIWIDPSWHIKAHPRKIIFNDTSSKIYELCSGKLTVAEIISQLRQSVEMLPPEPFFTKQVVEVLKELDERMLVIFSSL